MDNGDQQTECKLNMTKEAEQDYVNKIGEAGGRHALLKPFSDNGVGSNLSSMGTIFSLLPPPPGRLLDLGCGTGWTSCFFSLAGYDVVGQDIAPDMLTLAEQNKVRYAPEKLRFERCDYESLPFDAEFECAVFFDSLHHCDDEVAALRSVYRALKPGGVLITHEPGKGHSTNPHSIKAMELYGVNERDMPPSLIISAGRSVGFNDFRVLPMPDKLHQIFYAKHKRNTAAPAWLQAYRAFRRRIYLVGKMSKGAMDRGSIVVLTK